MTHATRLCPWLPLLALGATLAADPPARRDPAATWRAIAPFFRPPAEFADKFGSYRSPLTFSDGTRVRSTADWPAVMDALDAAGYRGYVTFEYFHPFLHYPEALIHQTSDALDRILGRKA